MAATRKEEKYVDLSARYIFEPIVVVVHDKDNNNDITSVVSIFAHCTKCYT